MRRMLPLALLPAVFAHLTHAARGPVVTPQILPTFPKDLGTPMQIIILMTLLTLLPAIIMSITPFLRISIVLHFLRQAMGTQTAPSNQVLLALSLFLTAVLVAPLGTRIYNEAWQPMERGDLTASEAWDTGTKPLKIYLGRFVREKDVQLFLDITHSQAPRSPADLDLTVLAPAYMLSEMRAGFQIGAILFLPFLLVDIVVASVTLSIGMVQLPPVMVSAPFKILLFVLVDGWNLTIGSLMKGFAA
jgi:flagellar biosynthesis protein FliP